MNDLGDQPREPHPTPDAKARSASVEVYILSNGKQLLQYIARVFPAALKATYDPIDVYQSVVFEAFRRAPSFNYTSDAATMSWLRLIARRQIGMTLRRERSRRAATSPDAPANTGPAMRLLEEYATYLRTPSKSAMRQEILRAVEQAMASLPTHLREAVKLRYIEGLSVADVAERMSRTPAAAHSLAYRGLRLLQRKLRAYSRFA